MEVTRYFKDVGKNGSPSHQKQEFLADVLRAGKEQYGTLSRCNVFTIPAQRISFMGLKKSVIVSALVFLVQQHKGAEILLETMDLPEPLRNIFSSIEIYPTPTYEAESLWQVVEAGLVDVICSSVQRRIDDKNKKIATYRKSAKPGARVQLLIYTSRWAYVGDHSSTGSPAGYGRITDELQMFAFNMDFDDVFFMDRERKQVIKLKKL